MGSKALQTEAIAAIPSGPTAPMLEAVRALVVNFNGPELNYLALALARQGQLSGFVRSYVNKGRPWERGLEQLPLAGKAYRSTIGRRKLDDQRLIDRTFEAGVGADLIGTAIGRVRALPDRFRQRLVHRYQESVRLAVAKRAEALAGTANCIIAYQGFGLNAFDPKSQRHGGRTVLNYPIAHHREHRRLWAEECRLEPEFASTWLGFGHWPRGYEQQLDDEISHADGILIGSNYARDTFIEAGVATEKLKVIPYGVDLDTFRPADASRDAARFEVVFAGQLSQRKGISYLLRGYRKFQRRDTRLTLVGEMISDGKPLRPFAGLFRHVPHLTRPALAEIYRCADVFVFPTLLEGMGLVVLEAMASGLPVIVTDHGPGDVVRDGVDGFVVPVRDEDAICDRLQLLYKDPDLRSRMGRNARQRAQSLGWDQYTGAVTAYLSGLVNSSRA